MQLRTYAVVGDGRIGDDCARDGGRGDDLVGHVPGRGSVADGLPDRAGQRVVEFVSGIEHHEQRHPVLSLRLLDPDHEGLGDLVELLDDVVDVRAAHPDAVAVQRGVGSPVHHH